MNEYRTTLQDSWLDFLGLNEPNYLNYLNFESNYQELPSIIATKSFRIEILLSNRIFVQKRVVYNLLMMFSDVGGLYDFLFIGLSSLIGYCTSYPVQANLNKNLFLVNSSNASLPKMMRYTLISSLICGLIPSKNCKSHRKLFMLG